MRICLKTFANAHSVRMKRGCDKLCRDESGNVLAITAFVVVIAVLFMLQFGSMIFLMKRKDELTDIAKTACNEGLKPTRTLSDADATRTAASVSLFDALSSDRGFTITNRVITQTFMKGSVTASATIKSINPLESQDKTYDIQVAATCQGIPPYPKKNDVLLSSDFTWPSTTPLNQTASDWANYSAKQLGWDSHTGYYIEVQDWSKPRFMNFAGEPLPPLSPDQTSPYAIELDSISNSSMTKRVELHEGVYEFSLWYLARVTDPSTNPDVNTNTIAVYLQGINPATAKVRKLRIFGNSPFEGWKRLSFEIPVSSYSLYDLTVAAEGKSDSLGGLFNTLELKYTKRPQSLYPQDYDGAASTANSD